MRWVMAIFYAAAGIAHLDAPDKLLAITPSWVPSAPQIIFVTGLCELAGAVALVTANFTHAIDGIDLPHVANSWLHHGPRPAFQRVLVWWALFSAGIIDWP